MDRNQHTNADWMESSDAFCNEAINRETKQLIAKVIISPSNHSPSFLPHNIITNIPNDKTTRSKMRSSENQRVPRSASRSNLIRKEIARAHAPTTTTPQQMKVVTGRLKVRMKWMTRKRRKRRNTTTLRGSIFQAKK